MIGLSQISTQMDLVNILFLVNIYITKGRWVGRQAVVFGHVMSRMSSLGSLLNGTL